ncbi:MAG: hypothetical protein IPH49_14295 [Ignavibacteria bacterium]|nr:hypothetical protein [Ignavibacteria bacterium]
MGRYVAVHDTAQSGDVPGRNQLRLYDLAQDTSYLFDGRSWARCDFDDEEQQMVFLSSGSIGSALCGNRLSIATLGEVRLLSGILKSMVGLPSLETEVL